MTDALPEVFWSVWLDAEAGDLAVVNNQLAMDEFAKVVDGIVEFVVLPLWIGGMFTVRRDRVIGWQLSTPETRERIKRLNEMCGDDKKPWEGE